jgi:hypothetical protein
MGRILAPDPATVRSLSQSLKVGLRQHTYTFIGFSDEERGKIGSQSCA